jgi:hypothetical protein
MLKQIIWKLIASSEDPKKVSRMVQGIVLLAGSQIVRIVDVVCSVGLTCVGIDEGLIKEAADVAELVVYAGMFAIGALWTAYGFMRKLALKRWSAPVEN